MNRSVHLVAVGDNVVDCYPDLGVMFPGGNAVNVAVHAARVGAKSTYVGVLGSDPAGDLLLHALRGERVGVERVRVVQGPNARAVVRIIDGNRVFESGDVGVSRFRVLEADLRAAAVANVVHTGECSMTEEDLPLLRSSAKLLSFDFSERPWDYIGELAPLVDVAVVSLPEGGERDAADAARRLRALGPSRAVVTRGSAGAVLLGPDGLVTAPAGVGTVVDTLGAGDAFIARLLVGLAAGEADLVALTAATAYATASCAHHGAFGYESPLEPATTAVPAGA